MQVETTAVRVFYAKTARAKYISHLDTMRTVTRALRRSRQPFWYTQGFNPHLYITFALPLSLGYEGLRESFDVKMTQDVDMTALAKAIGAVMPDGFTVLEAAAPVMKPADIMWADYSVKLIYRAEDMERVKESLEVFNRQPVLEVTKRTKKGEQVLDIRPLVQNLSEEWGGDSVALTLRAAAGISLNINPTLYLKAFYSWMDLQPEGVRVVRTGVLTKDLEDFR